jgi:hypothetical protein
VSSLAPGQAFDRLKRLRQRAHRHHHRRHLLRLAPTGSLGLAPQACLGTGIPGRYSGSVAGLPMTRTAQ